MTDYKINARSVINSFLYSELINKEILFEDDYRPDGFTKSLIPIIPAQEMPEFNNLMPEVPYIIYDYSVEGYGDAWWICEETLTYTIMGNQMGEVIEIMELMVDLFRRIDQSGKDLQIFNPKKSIIKFYTISLESASSPEPIDLESKKFAGTVTISYKYSRILDGNGRFV